MPKIDKRKEQYKKIMMDPNKRSLYRSKAKERQRKYLSKFYDGSELLNRKKIVLQLLKNEIDPAKKQDLEKELQLINLELENHPKFIERQNKNKEIATKLREIKKSNNLEGLCLQLQTRIATQKHEIKKSIIRKLMSEKNILFENLINNVAVAKQNNDTAYLAKTTKELNKAMNNYAEQQNEVRVYAEHSSKFLIFKNEILSVNADSPKEEIEKLIQYGNELYTKYNQVKFFIPLTETTSKIINHLQGGLL